MPQGNIIKNTEFSTQIKMAVKATKGHIWYIKNINVTRSTICVKISYFYHK